MNWQQLISNKRLGQEDLHIDRKDDRTEFRRDYDRLIFSAPFRRLQNKTQVFPLPGSVFVHNRLTHSLEVASVGRSLGDDVAHALIEKQPELANTHILEIGSIVSANVPLLPISWKTKVSNTRISSPQSNGQTSHISTAMPMRSVCSLISSRDDVLVVSCSLIPPSPAS